MQDWSVSPAKMAHLIYVEYLEECQILAVITAYIVYFMSVAHISTFWSAWVSKCFVFITDSHVCWFVPLCLGDFWFWILIASSYFLIYGKPEGSNWDILSSKNILVWFFQQSVWHPSKLLVYSKICLFYFVPIPSAPLSITLTVNTYSFWFQVIHFYFFYLFLPLQIAFVSSTQDNHDEKYVLYKKLLLFWRWCLQIFLLEVEIQKWLCFTYFLDSTSLFLPCVGRTMLYKLACKKMQDSLG